MLARVATRIPEERPDRLVDEVAVRAPAFVAGILSIGALAWFLWRLGFGAAGVLASWLLALHPWALRYLSEARGYSLAMLLGSLALVAGIAALHHGRWRRWLGFGLAQFLLLWNLPSTLWFVVLLNLAILASILGLHRGEGRRVPLTRWALANGFGAMLWLPLMAPNVPQLLSYLARNKRDWVGPGWPSKIASHLTVGMDWQVGGAPHYPELATRYAGEPMLVGAILAVAALLLVLGAMRLWRTGGLARNLLWVLLLPLPLTYLQVWWSQDRTYIWYFVFFLPGVLALTALGVAGLAGLVPERRRTLAGVAIGAVFLAAITWLGTPAREALRTRAYYPVRDSVLLTRPNLDPRSPENERILTASWSGQAVYYDPRVRGLRTVEELLALMAQADEQGAPLFVNLGRPRMAAARAPESFAVVEDPERFERVGVLRGFLPPRTRYVYRYLGADGRR